MSTLVQQIIEKYQGSAPQRVVNAVSKAAAATGADFSQLMQKASTESGFNPSAKSSTSSATGLFQFIESTWLGMVKEHGAQLGLGHYADQIQIKNGKPCVANCEAKDKILNLRKNPEISAMMAGMASADDQNYLQAHTDGDVGGTEMYLAHFMGAGTAAKFLNARDDNGSTSAAQLFPKQAHANRSIFYTASGHARSLDQVYNLLAKKVGDTAVAENNTGADQSPLDHPLASSDTTAPASSTHTTTPSSHGMPSMPSMMAQALPLSSASSSDGIIWDTPAMTRTHSGSSHSHGGFSGSGSGFIPSQKLSADSILLMAQMQHSRVPGSTKDEQHYNS